MAAVKSPKLTRSSPIESYQRSREDAIAMVSVRGLKAAREVMERAQRELEARLERTLTVGAGQGSFTAEKLQATLGQIRAIVTEFSPELFAGTTNVAQQAAELAAANAVRYITEADAKFVGINQRLGIKEGEVFDRAIRGANSSILNRLRGDEKSGPGIRSRYEDSVVGKFEETLRQRFIQGTPWEEVRAQLQQDSSFLRGAPLSWAERIVRTEVMNAHNAANFATMQGANRRGDMLKILAATFDSRTAADSYAVHGQIRRVDEPFNDWTHAYMHPPNRPNDREVVVPHNIAWPIPAELAWKTDAEVASRWREMGRKGSPPMRPRMTTVPLEQIGKPPDASKAPAQQVTPSTPLPPPSHRGKAAPKELDQPKPGVVPGAPPATPPARTRTGLAYQAEDAPKVSRDAPMSVSTPTEPNRLETQRADAQARAAVRSAAKAAKDALTKQIEAIKLEEAKQARATVEAAKPEEPTVPRWVPLEGGGYRGEGFKTPVELRKDKAGWYAVIEGRRHILPNRATFDHAERLLTNLDRRRVVQMKRKR